MQFWSCVDRRFLLGSLSTGLRSEWEWMCELSTLRSWSYVLPLPYYGCNLNSHRALRKVQEKRLIGAWQIQNGQSPKYSDLRACLYCTDSSGLQRFAVHTCFCIQILPALTYLARRSNHQSRFQLDLPILLLEEYDQTPMHAKKEGRLDA